MKSYIKQIFSPNEIWTYIFAESIMQTEIHSIGQYYIKKLFNNIRNIQFFD